MLSVIKLPSSSTHQHVCDPVGWFGNKNIEELGLLARIAGISTIANEYGHQNLNNNLVDLPQLMSLHSKISHD